MLDHIEPLSRSHPQRREQARSTRDKLVQEGLRQVQERGWAATGIDLVLRECKVPKGSFYHYFASKEAFGFALLDSYQATAMQRLEAWFVRQPTSSLEQLCAALDGFLDAVVADMQNHSYQRSCLLGTLGQDVGSLHDGFRQRLLESLLQWEEVLANALFNCSSSYAKDSGLDKVNSKTVGLIDLKAQCEAWAQEFWAAWQGAMWRSVLARNPAALQAAVKRLQQQLMDMALVQRARSAVPAGAKPTSAKTQTKGKLKTKPDAKSGTKPHTKAHTKAALWDAAEPPKVAAAKPVKAKKPKKISAVQVTLDF